MLHAGRFVQGSNASFGPRVDIRAVLDEHFRDLQAAPKAASSKAV